MYMASLKQLSPRHNRSMSYSIYTYLSFITNDVTSSTAVSLIRHKWRELSSHSDINFPWNNTNHSLRNMFSICTLMSFKISCNPAFKLAGVSNANTKTKLNARKSEVRPIYIYHVTERLFLIFVLLMQRSKVHLISHTNVLVLKNKRILVLILFSFNTESDYFSHEH